MSSWEEQHRRQRALTYVDSHTSACSQHVAVPYGLLLMEYHVSKRGEGNAPGHARRRGRERTCAEKISHLGLNANSEDEITMMTG